MDQSIPTTPGYGPAPPNPNSTFDSWSMMRDPPFVTHYERLNMLNHPGARLSNLPCDWPIKPIWLFIIEYLKGILESCMFPYESKPMRDWHLSELANITHDTIAAWPANADAVMHFLSFHQLDAVDLNDIQGNEEDFHAEVKARCDRLLRLMTLEIFEDPDKDIEEAEFLLWTIHEVRRQYLAI